MASAEINDGNEEVPSLLSMDMKPNAHVGDTSQESDLFVRIRGLPFAATLDQVMAFFHDVNICGGESGITITYTRDGRPSGEAYVCVASAEDQAKALAHNKEHIGNRYIEIFDAVRDEMEYVVKKSGPQPSSFGDGVLRLRGLPFGCSKEEIMQFFTGYEIVPNGITMTTDLHGRTAGDAYVQFSTQNIAERAIDEKHMKRIGHRYIELFRSTSMEARQATMPMSSGGPPGRRPMRPAPYDRSDRYGGPRGSGYDPYSSPRDRFIGGSGGRFRESSMGNGDRYSTGDRYTGGDRFSTGNGGFRNGAMRGRGGRPGGPRGGAISSPMYKSSTGHSIHMRGLPYSASENDIAMFFSPIVPINIYLGLNSDGRKSGEADVDFDTHDEACEAMKKDKSNMDHRYIELFLNSSSGGPPRNRARNDFGAPPEDRFSSVYGGGGVGHGNGDFGSSDVFKAPGGFGFNSMTNQGNSDGFF